MNRLDYAQGVVRTRVIEKRLLTRSHILRLLDAADLAGVFKILGETEYSQTISRVRDNYDYEKVLLLELIRVYDLMRDVSAEGWVIDLHALKYDYHNLKVFVKERYLHEDLSRLYIPLGTDGYKQLRQRLEEGGSPGEDQFARALKAAESSFEEEHEPQAIDLTLDMCYFSHLFGLAEKCSVELFIDYVRMMIDFANVLSFIRMQRQNKSIAFFEKAILPDGTVSKNDILTYADEPVQKLIDLFKGNRTYNYMVKGLQAYEKSGSLAEFEKNMDNCLMELCSTAKNVIFGPEPIFTYIQAKETEIRNLRIIMAAKANNIAPEIISERLRDLYV